MCSSAWVCNTASAQQADRGGGALSLLTVLFYNLGAELVDHAHWKASGQSERPPGAGLPSPTINALLAQVSLPQ